ncbi:MAG: NAD-dependent epimerase/dehydratase family protein [Acidobacteriota bacterium]
MKLIVTGASGFLGRNALLRAPREWDITALYHRTAGLDAFVARHQLSNVRVMRCNLLEADEVKAVARVVGTRADAVLYFAANGDPAVSSERPRWDLESNATAIVTFLENCSADHLVFASSGAVYDGLTGTVGPATPVSPVLPYAISKLASEHYVRFFAERRGTLGSYINVRFFGAYGPFEAARKITTRWLQAMAAGQREFVVRGDGQNLIDFMYVDDAIDGYLALAAARGSSATVDFASGAPATIDAVVAAMARALGVEITIRHEGHVPEYIQFCSGDTTMRDRFGIVSSVSFDEGFKRLQAFFAREARASA